MNIITSLKTIDRLLASIGYPDIEYHQDIRAKIKNEIFGLLAWQTIDTLPKTGETVLAYNPISCMVVGARWLYIDPEYMSGAYIATTDPDTDKDRLPAGFTLWRPILTPDELRAIRYG